jgi:hypothetical protein
MFQNIKRFPDQKIFSGAIEVETLAKILKAQYSIEKTSDCEIVNYFDASIKTTVICTSCAVFHKSIFDEIGNFDTNLKSGQDTDLWIRMGLIYPIVFSWKVLARYVYDPQSLSKKREFITQKLDFSKFSEAEKEHTALKKFLDLNRFAFAIKCKLNNDNKSFNGFYAAIDLKNISTKKRILLLTPAFVLKILIQVNLVLVRMGLSNSVFK